DRAARQESLARRLLHCADQFEKRFGSYFLIASHGVFLTIVVNDAHRELEAIGLAGRRSKAARQIEKSGRSDQLRDLSGDTARQRCGVECYGWRQDPCETTTAIER